eukprot:symbB.v1.2.024559.t1/scaffold2334.1/size145401/1
MVKTTGESSSSRLRTRDTRRLAQILLQRPATGSSTKMLKADLSALRRFRGKACPHFGKRGVVEFFAQQSDGETAPPRFNKYAGWVEWKNAIFLWVNAVGGSFENAFANGGQKICWYVGGTNPTERSPVVRRLLSLKRDTQVILFIRPSGTDPYIVCGPCSYVAHNAQKKGFEFTWSLNNFASLKKCEAFQEIIAATQRPTKRARMFLFRVFFGTTWKDLLVHLPAHGAAEETLREAIGPYLPRWRYEPSSLTEVLQILVKQKKFLEAERLLRCLRHEELEVNIIHYNCAICAAERGDAWRFAIKTLAETRQLSVLPDVVSFNTVLSSAMRQWRDALLTLQTMEAESLQISAISINSVLSASEKSSAWETALLLFSTGERGSPDVFGHSATIGACSKVKYWEEALRCVPSSKKANVVTYGASIKACEEAGRFPNSVDQKSS